MTALRRPPVRQSALVRSDQRHTFDTFVDTIGYPGGAYREGWARILGRFAAAAGGPA